MYLLYHLKASPLAALAVPLHTDTHTHTHTHEYSCTPRTGQVRLYVMWCLALVVNESERESHWGVSDSLWACGLYSPWNSPGQNTGVGSLFSLRGIFPTQGLNPGLPHCRPILYQLSCQGSPRILEWVTYPFFRGSSRPRNWTRVSCTAGRFFTNWAIWEALYRE